MNLERNELITLLLIRSGVVKLRELSTARGNKYSSFGSTANFVNRLVAQGLVSRDPFKTGTLRPTLQGQELAKNLYLARIGSKLEVYKLHRRYDETSLAS